MKSSHTLQNHMKLIKSVFVISCVGVVGFLATQALYTDRETSQTANFVVGTLDMSVSGENNKQTESLSVSGVGAEQNVSGAKTWIIHNTGTLPGSFSLDIKNVRNFENGCNEPESLEDSTCENPGDGQGELGKKITIALAMKQGSEEKTVYTSTLGLDQAEQYQTLWEQGAGKVVVPAGKELTIRLNWSAAEQVLGNDVQGDSATFDLIFNLKQVSSQGN